MLRKQLLASTVPSALHIGSLPLPSAKRAFKEDPKPTSMAVSPSRGALLSVEAVERAFVVPSPAPAGSCDRIPGDDLMNLHTVITTPGTASQSSRTPTSA